MGNEQSNIQEQTESEKNPEKHENGSVNCISPGIPSGGIDIDGKIDTTVHQNGEPHIATQPTELEVVPSEIQAAGEKAISEIDATVVSEIAATTPVKEEAKKKKEGKASPFLKMFKKKAEPTAEAPAAQENEAPSEDQTDVSPPPTDPQQETANLKTEPETLTEAETVTLDSGPEEEKDPEPDSKNSQPEEHQEETNPEENSVMNFFKTLVTPKTSKKETSTPDAKKDQSQKETQPAATTTVAQICEPPTAPKGMPAPPPPPPEPPKVELKGDPSSKPTKPTAKEEPKAVAKEPTSSKGKSARNTLSKFFHPKTNKDAQPVAEVQETPADMPEPVVEEQTENKEAAAEVPQPVIDVQVDGIPQTVVETEKVDSSKAGTLEAAAKPEPTPPAQEEKKAASKGSFFSLFKSKTAEPKKVNPAPPAAGEAPQAVKAKEEPKAAAKSPDAAAESKPASAASQAGDDAASVPKKLEKRNSIQLFFKTLTQKRHSTDAGVQTEPLTATSAEKAK
ncbi:breast carcinoma-amplified sequence 1 isoform 1-T2 [Pholidichthys leucotaenia]